MCLVFGGVEHWPGTNQSGLQTEDWKAQKASLGFEAKIVGQDADEMLRDYFAMRNRRVRQSVWEGYISCSTMLLSVSVRHIYLKHLD